MYPKNGFVACLLYRTEYKSNTLLPYMSIDGFDWTELYQLDDFGIKYDDITTNYQHDYDSMDKTNEIKEQMTIGIYKPGPVLYIKREMAK